MAAAIRRVCGAAGIDPADAPLVAYGGAAGQHAAAVAQRVGMPEVVLHGMASVLSAWGQSLAAREEEAVSALWAPLTAAWPRVEAEVARLDAGLPAWPARDVWLDLRPAGGDHALEVVWTPGTPIDAVLAGYRAQHRAIFGFDSPDGEVELASVRVRRRAPPEPPAAVDDPWGVGDRVVVGPARLDGGGTSVQVPVGWSARWSAGLLRMTRDAPPLRAEPTTRSEHGLAVWSSRLTDVAVRAGEHLRRLARSVNIRERLDFSCAVFDGDGHLVVNAPHIPVHLGAMGETVRDLLRHVPDPADGDTWLTNDPLAGGSHLPDLTVITCVRHGSARFFVACRGHHVDVGGVTPGSMPPRATRLDEEGACVARLPLVVGGILGDLSPLLSASRQPAVVAADLNAQLAANRLAAALLRGLGPPEVVAAWCQHLMDAADEAVRRALPALVDGVATDALDGVPLRLALRVRPDGLEIDLTGTGGPHPGNLNAPPAVLCAAVLYVLRGLVDDGLPLNEGALRSVRMVVPHPSIVSPPQGAAVAGGNVETSQRLVDLLLAALGRRAGSQGTMNNLTLGGHGWSLYETLGGGYGATPAAAGRSGRQVHMTNTRATDPEVLERRLPLRVRRFTLRRGSGGAGAQRGGDGLVRELEVLAPAVASLLASRRDVGPAGAAGGGDGAPGCDQIQRVGGWSAWDGASVALAPGDAVRVETPGGGGWGRQSASDLGSTAPPARGPG
jgi:5-oxoprolinase (ATP-hydrolysing)